MITSYANILAIKFKRISFENLIYYDPVELNRKIIIDYVLMRLVKIILLSKLYD